MVLRVTIFLVTLVFLVPTISYKGGINVKPSLESNKYSLIFGVAQLPAKDAFGTLDIEFICSWLWKSAVICEAFRQQVSWKIGWQVATFGHITGIMIQCLLNPFTKIVVLKWALKGSL